MTDTDARDASAARELLRDSFTRLVEHVDEVTAGLTEEVASYRPTLHANSIAWLLWHSARCQDVQVSELAGHPQVWIEDGWYDRFGLDLPPEAMGFGDTPADVNKVVAPAELLAGYYHAVHDMTLRYVNALTLPELERIVDRRWNPPVTASARLVSVVDDCAQHLGQAAYVRGIAPGADWKGQY